MLSHTNIRQGIKAKRAGANGFTLIELLVVIVILGILAAVVVFAVSGISNRGKKDACRTDVRTLRTAVEAYRAQNDSYPASEAALVSGGFLSEESAQHGFTVSGNTVTITGTNCDTL